MEASDELSEERTGQPDGGNTVSAAAPAGAPAAQAEERSGVSGAERVENAAETMQITFKLYATLQDLLPRGAVKNAVRIDVAEDATLHEIIDRHQVPRKLAHLVLVNGVFFCEADRDARGLLKPGDVLAIWPPVAGG